MNKFSDIFGLPICANGLVWEDAGTARIRHEETYRMRSTALCTRRFTLGCVFCLALAFFAITAGVNPAPARAACLDDFSITTHAHPNGILVQVDYNHPIWGWVEAGTVDFLDNGRIMLTLRGEDTREITDLRQALGAMSVQRVGSPALGQQLAARIQQSAGS